MKLLCLFLFGFVATSLCCGPKTGKSSSNDNISSGIGIVQDETNTDYEINTNDNGIPEETDASYNGERSYASNLIRNLNKTLQKNNVDKLKECITKNKNAPNKIYECITTLIGALDGNCLIACLSSSSDWIKYINCAVPKCKKSL